MALLALVGWLALDNAPVRVHGEGAPARGLALVDRAPGAPQLDGDGWWSNQFLLGADDSVYAMDVSGSDVYVGDAVPALWLRGADLFVGGTFIQAGTLGVNRIARWSSLSNSWSALGSGANDTVLAIAADANAVYAGGFFAQAGGKSANFLSRWAKYPLYLPAMVR